MVLVTSAEYVGPELSVEIGKIPPAFLPIGSVRLYERQVEVIRSCFPHESIYLSIPENYSVPSCDTAWFDENNVTLLTVPRGLSLAESVLYCLNWIGDYSSTTRILHGDTFVSSIPSGEPNAIGVGIPDYEYSWEYDHPSGMGSDGQAARAWCGYFSISDTSKFIKNLLRNRTDFVAAVREYDQDVRSSRVEFSNWYDLGHINTYFATRKKFVGIRYFNNLEPDGENVFKSSSEVTKMEAEALWYRSLPEALRSRCPAFLGTRETPVGVKGYSLEYLPWLPLNELYVHGEKSAAFWEKVDAKVLSLLDDFRRCAADVSNGREIAVKSARKLLVDKTKQRLAYLEEHKEDVLRSKITLNEIKVPSLEKVVSIAIDQIRIESAVPAVMHGDLCFSNILVNTRDQSIKVIDPRGIFDSEDGIIGDQRYDLAKYYHSVIGYYDFIVSGRFRLAADDTEWSFDILHNEASVRYGKVIKSRLLKSGKRDEIYAIMVLLFVTMIPLHADDSKRQMAFVANVFRLWTEWREGK